MIPDQSDTCAIDNPNLALNESAVVRSIGNTPLLRLRRLECHFGFPSSVELYLKAEWVNPGGSIKDP